MKTLALDIRFKIPYSLNHDDVLMALEEHCHSIDNLIDSNGNMIRCIIFATYGLLDHCGAIRDFCFEHNIDYSRAIHSMRLITAEEERVEIEFMRRGRIVFDLGIHLNVIGEVLKLEYDENGKVVAYHVYVRRFNAFHRVPVYLRHAD